MCVREAVLLVFMERRARVSALCIAPLLFGCSAAVVSVLPAHGPNAALTAAPPPIAVVLDATTVPLPLGVKGAGVSFGDVDRALLRSVEQAVAAASPRLTLPPGSHLELQVELVDGRAEYSRGQLVVVLAARATLRHRKGNTYVAQTHAHATASAHSPPEHGASAVLACTDKIATDLTGWLLGLELH